MRVHHPGVLPAVRAVGWVMPTYGHAQVSLNLLDFTVTPMHTAWRAVSEQAAAHGVRVVGSELVGLVPLDALRAAGRDALGEGAIDAPDATLVEAAVRALGLDAIHPFDPRERVLEWAIAASPRACVEPGRSDAYNLGRRGGRGRRCGLVAGTTGGGGSLPPRSVRTQKSCASRAACLRWLACRPCRESG